MAANFGSDPWLDARLRNVPLPIGMLGRLSQLTNPPDEQLDAAVRDVPLPEGLAERLQQIPALPESRLPAWKMWLPERSLGLPAGGIGRRELALAAALLLAVGMGYWMIAARYFGQADSGDVGHPNLVASDPAASNPIRSEETLPDEFVLDSPVPSGENEDDTWLASPDDGVPLFAPIEFKPLPLPSPRARRSQSQLFASNVAIDRQPALETVIAPADRGLPPPLLAGYDLLSHLKTGERSFAAPSADPKLAWTLIPLRHDTSSYRLAQRYVSQGRLPPPEDVRIEDFLSAQNDHYPPSENKLVIRVEAGTAPLGEPGLRLLQVGVQAGQLATARPATDLIIAVDTSASMRHGRRLEMVRAALRRLAGELKPNDRITLIGFSDDAELLVDDLRLEAPGADGRPAGAVDRAAVERLLAAVSSLRPDDGTNVGAAVELATSAILRVPAEPARQRQLVLLSDGLADLGPSTGGQIAAMLRSLSQQGVKFGAIDVSGERDASGPLAELAEAGGGRCRQAADTDEIAAALSDALAGVAQTVAHSASLKVTFNPQAVRAYRLVGHATATITGPASASTQVDLHADARSAGLFELWLEPGGGDDVATAELSWNDTAGAASQKLTQRISRLQFAKSFAESPLPLQAAYVAAETARSLRNQAANNHANSGRNFARVLELAGQVHPQLQASDSFRELVALISRADKLRSSGAGTRRPTGAAKP